LICDKNTPSAVLADAIQAAAGPLLESIRLFDVYEGAQLPQGKKSLAYHLILRCQDRTLNDEETDVIIQKIIAELGRINVLLR
ncbi:MAG TPA: phenylalanine--tRNA ligase subunit beta, partial [Clostridiales bacterium]|nr:phenylalanine--tRNA ligase subunit beta [Clostridiales bacterium]